MDIIHEIEDVFDGTTEKYKQEPVPVKIESERMEAADYASWQTYRLTGLEPPQVILAQDAKRRRAVVIVTGIAAASLRIGALGSVSNGQGGSLFPGNTVTLENQREHWIIGDGVNPITVTVLDERYQ